MKPFKSGVHHLFSNSVSLGSLGELYLGDHVEVLYCFQRLSLPPFYLLIMGQGPQSHLNKFSCTEGIAEHFKRSNKFHADGLRRSRKASLNNFSDIQLRLKERLSGNVSFAANKLGYEIATLLAGILAVHHSQPKAESIFFSILQAGGLRCYAVTFQVQQRQNGHSSLFGNAFLRNQECRRTSNNRRGGAKKSTSKAQPVSGVLNCNSRLKECRRRSDKSPGKNNTEAHSYSDNGRVVMHSEMFAHYLPFVEGALA